MREESVMMDIDLFLMIALGSNEHLHKTISDMYQANEMEYFHLYQESIYNHNPFFDRYKTIKSESMKKVGGIVLSDNLHGTNENIMKLIKKGYKHPLNFYTQRTIIDLDEFMFLLAKKHGGIEELSELDMLYNGMILLYLINLDKHKQNKAISLMSPAGQFLRNGLKNLYYNTSVSMEGYQIEQLEQKQDEMIAIQERFQMKKIKNQRLDVIFDRIILHEEMQVSQRRSEWRNYDRIRTATFREGLCKYIGAFSAWLKYLGIDEIDITNTELSQKEIKEVFYEALRAEQDNHISSEQQDMYIVGCFFLLAVIKELKHTQNIYFRDVKSHLYEELIQMKNELDNQKNQLVIAKKKYEKHNDVVAKENEELKSENERLKQEIAILQKAQLQSQKQKEEKRLNQKELFALREYIFSIENAEEPTEDCDQFKQMINSLEGVKGVIVGGKSNWQNKLKEHLPSFTFVSPENKGIDLSFIDNSDAVFINTAYNNHALYNRLMSRLQKSSTPLYYLKSSTNVQILIQDIFSKITFEHTDTMIVN